MSHDTQEFIVTSVRFDARGYVLSWRFELVRLVQVTENWRDHIDMMLEEDEEYHKLLWDLEPLSEEEDWWPSRVYTLGVVQYF